MLWEYSTGIFEWLVKIKLESHTQMRRVDKISKGENKNAILGK